jgi:hypothetical protein
MTETTIALKLRESDERYYHELMDEERFELRKRILRLQKEATMEVGQC